MTRNASEIYEDLKNLANELENLARTGLSINVVTGYGELIDRVSG